MLVAKFIQFFDEGAEPKQPLLTLIASFLPATALAAMRWAQDYYLFILGAGTGMARQAAQSAAEEGPGPQGPGPSLRSRQPLVTGAGRVPGPGS